VLAGRDGTWVLPKGTPDGGESLEETAAREVREETGLDVRILRPLGTIEYWFALPRGRVHKVVHFFLMEATGGDVSRHDHEYDDVRWVPVEEARRLLTFDTYREMLERALAAEAAV
jgi:8-oxo-dGTP pyrophosphatase MutT (NUDIX family)